MRDPYSSLLLDSLAKQIKSLRHTNFRQANHGLMRRSTDKDFDRAVAKVVKQNERIWHRINKILDLNFVQCVVLRLCVSELHVMLWRLWITYWRNPITQRTTPVLWDGSHRGNPIRRTSLHSPELTVNREVLHYNTRESINPTHTGV